MYLLLNYFTMKSTVQSVEKNQKSNLNNQTENY